MISIAAKTTTYFVDLAEVKNLFASKLNVPVAAISVEYIIQEVGGDPLDRYPGHNEVTGIRVTVDNVKVETMQQATFQKEPE